MSIQNLTGQTLGQYDLLEVLGIGGMSIVYLGFQNNLKREVAVKVLSSQLAQDPGYIERFTREAETAAALEHSHIVPVYDYGTQQGTSFVVMRLLTGGTLAQRIAQRAEDGQPLPSLGELSDLLKQLASALDYAHSRGVLHRDIKPSNVMFDNQGTAYLVDFGIAKLLESTSSLTGTGVSMGTPNYMSPEQWRAEPLSPATDQYALGAMMYLLITGQPPFKAPTPYALMHKHLHELPTPPQVVRPDVPEAVAHVLGRALAKHSDERFPTATAFAEAFERATEGQTGEYTAFFTMPVRPHAIRPAPLTSVSQPQPLPATLYKSPLLWGMGLVALGLIIAAAVIAFLLGGNSRESANLAAAQTQTSLQQTQIAVNATQTAMSSSAGGVTAGDDETLQLTATAVIVNQAQTATRIAIAANQTATALAFDQARTGTQLALDSQLTATTIAMQLATGSATTPTRPDGVSIEMEVLRRTWVSVIVDDGQTRVEGYQNAGERLSYSGNRSIQVGARDAGAIRLTVNGEPVEELGARGEEFVHTFYADGVPTSTPTRTPAPSATPRVPAAE